MFLCLTHGGPARVFIPPALRLERGKIESAKSRFWNATAGLFGKFAVLEHGRYGPRIVSRSKNQRRRDFRREGLHAETVYFVQSTTPLDPQGAEAIAAYIWARV